jgi:hypothetical protein
LPAHQVRRIGLDVRPPIAGLARLTDRRRIFAVLYYGGLVLVLALIVAR